MWSIVIIEDEALLGRRIARALEGESHEVVVAQTGADGLAALASAAPDLVLLDLRLPDCSGLDVLERVRAEDRDLPVILMTAYGTVEDAVTAMRAGATDYVQKPLDLDELRLLIGRVLDRQRRDHELAYLRRKDAARPAGIVGKDSRLLQIFSQLENLREVGLAPGRRPAVLLTGETGTGKGLIARALHELLGGGPFIEINCTAMPSELVEAELFGHERGTFTDAKTSRAGLFEAAAGGALFLDEIGHASPELQAKMLKVIEEKRIRRLGSTRDREVDVHVIAATNRDLQGAVNTGEFRPDLLHRLSVLSFEVPPLRTRGDDLAALAEHFCETIGQTYGRAVSLSAQAQAELARYPWPGNVRELRNVIERALLVTRGPEIGPGVFAGLLAGVASEEPVGEAAFHLPEAGIDLAEVERDLIQQALERTEGNRTQAARLLGLSRDTLRYRLEKFQIE